jgi:hypothetical protein
MRSDPTDRLHPALGKQLAEFSPNYIRAAKLVFFGSTVVAAGIVPLLFGLKLVDLPIADGPGERLAAVVLGVLLIGFGIFVVADGVRSIRSSVLVFEHGFAARGGLFEWDRIAAFYQLVGTFDVQGILRFPFATYRIRCDDGRSCTFDLGVSGATELASVIQRVINPGLLSKARADIAAGQAVDFGIVSLTPAGIRYGHDGRETKLATWEQIESLSVNGLILRVRTVGMSRMERFGEYLGGLPIAVRRVANLEVFLTLVSEMRTTATP